jgi:hypothetical protein
LLDAKTTVNTGDFVNNGEGPTSRRRQDREAMNRRDRRAWELQRRGWSVRAIARELGIPASSVQRCLERARKRAGAGVLRAPDHLLPLLDTDPTAENVADDPSRWRALNALERYRLRHEPAAAALVDAGHRLAPVHDDDHRLCCLAHGIDQHWTSDAHGAAAHPLAPDDDW